MSVTKYGLLENIMYISKIIDLFEKLDFVQKRLNRYLQCLII